QRDADARENGKKKREAEEQLRQAESKLYRALLAKAAALRRERQPGYRREVWDSLREARQLKVAADGGAAIRAEVLACLGGPIGLDKVKPDTVVRRAPSQIPEEFRKSLGENWEDVKTRPWALGPGGYFFVHFLRPGQGGGVLVWARDRGPNPGEAGWV